MNGCLRGVIRLFVFLLLLLGVAAAWWYRAPLTRTVERFLGRRPTSLPAVSPDSGVGAPSPTALASAQSKLAALGRVRGPDSVVLRPVHSVDGMTAQAVPMPPDLLAAMRAELLALEGVAAVLYDLTHKPPATIEWE